MNITGSDKLNKIGGYAFDEVNKIVAKLKSEGVTPIDFGVGDPTAETPEFVRDAVKIALDSYSKAGYPSYIGQKEYRQAVSRWMNRRFGIGIDGETEICSTLGSKEAVFHFPQAFINEGDIVILPNPGYPPMKTGTIFAGGIPYFVSLKEESDFLLDYQSIPEDIIKKAKIIWINYPNSPTGACATKEYYEGLINWAHKHNIIIAADEGCYIDTYFDKKPISILEIAKEGIITFYSLSKRNNMTGYRVGWVAGDQRIIEKFKKLKTNIDSGTPDFIQTSAISALNDEAHAKQMRDEYKEKRDIMLETFKQIGWTNCKSEATFYLWLKTPNGINSVEFAKQLLDKDIAIVVTPGAWISDVDKDGFNPGKNFVRFALVPPLKQVKEASERIKKFYK
ncbi:MAG: Aminotransferase [Candidatus Nomurabacteria bacterium GW2011_GWF2_35_66]|uniref:Aminotransferase n=1 Tax=Candidatus Nomurabacteria bacterium GW2011_GWE1_35_16 TaxID=1618761 RepID=A0A0G0BBV2_9BACT|nr:MAG: Aminotransferase [Candidatus Nomurabacteria bacterium GW2011_GWF1_34_20]KKP63622.1 MAG: Aminotransferase [Candidatus Nomurabacteria bacterium GW2011_GWE2_34_25]KKP66824.1 MAG: Aminotransferase [Candidatus Nomurabacteria bacterium GW2011_GWE1_35_16]KKP83450.1 MAG: Aminotransferase [Candidatus Nomurabacteria bacterium GW2011_GWF2_35_66]HAE36618.1 LL-diaminopimelate aminotransferase [Candidatus Nomurabacteria bacterium]